MMASVGGLESAIGFFTTFIFFLLIVATWIVIAASRFLHGGTVERVERVPQLYGYTICLIAVLWGLVSLSSIIDGAFDLQAPAYAQLDSWSGYDASITSFEAYRATYRQSEAMRSTTPLPPDTTSETTLRERYEALRADRVDRALFTAIRSIGTGVLTLAIAVVLFVVHWRWLRRRGLSAEAPAA